MTGQIRQLVESSDNASTQFVRQALQGRMRTYRAGNPLWHSGLSSINQKDTRSFSTAKLGLGVGCVPHLCLEHRSRAK